MKIKTIKQNLSLLLSCVLILTNVFEGDKMSGNESGEAKILSFTFDLENEANACVTMPLQNVKFNASSVAVK